jgi:hypothetical protein
LYVYLPFKNQTHYARPARQRKPPARTMSLADEVEPPSPGRKKARAEAGALTDFKSEDD